MSKIITADNIYGRNFIDNSRFIINQRLPSSSPVTAGAAYFPMDRWFITLNSTPAYFTITQDTSYPSNLPYDTKSCKFLTSTASASVSGDLITFYQTIEGPDFAYLNNKTVTLSFDVLSSLTGIYCTSMRLKNTTPSYQNYISEYTVNSANTWEHKTITVNLAGAGLTAPNYTEGETGMFVHFDLGSGSSTIGTANQWLSGSAGVWKTSNQVKLGETLNAVWQITNVKLETGPVETACDYLTFDKQLDRCKRFYQKSYTYTVTPGTATYINAIFTPLIQAEKTIAAGYEYPVKMAKAPTIVLYSPNSGASASICDGYGHNFINATANDITQNKWRYLTHSEGESYPGYPYVIAHFHYTAETNM